MSRIKIINKMNQGNCAMGRIKMINKIILCCFSSNIFLFALILAPWAKAQENGPGPFAKILGYKTILLQEERLIPPKIAQRWSKVLEAEKKSPSLSSSGSKLPDFYAGKWMNLIREAPKLDELRKLQIVNGFFNQFTPKADQKNYGSDEHWATPAEFFKAHAGDCEDYCIAKYFALRVLGFPAEKMRIVLVHETRFNSYHSVLAVNTARGIFILDNNVRPRNIILPQDKFTGRYTPFLAFNEDNWWVFEKKAVEDIQKVSKERPRVSPNAPPKKPLHLK